MAVLHFEAGTNSYGGAPINEARLFGQSTADLVSYAGLAFQPSLIHSRQQHYIRVDEVRDLDNSLAIVEAVKAGDVLLQRSFPRDRQGQKLRDRVPVKGMCFGGTVELTLESLRATADMERPQDEWTNMESTLCSPVRIECGGAASER